MVWNSPELSLELSPPAGSRPGTDFLTRLPFLEEIDCKELQRLSEFINRLEDEVNKIQAFKRELPLSFLILTDAIGKLKEEARKQAERRKEGKLDEVTGPNSGNDQVEKKSWMSSAQLWSPRDEDHDNDQRREWHPCKKSGDGGAFPSFTESSGASVREEVTDTVLPGLSLVTPGLKRSAAVEPGSGMEETVPSSAYYTLLGQTGSPQNKLPFQTGKKQRRSWSPELHRRFIDALEKLGGSQVATPKQIREVMQVDGLTNDEVKSHLQKYRLHVRKLPVASGTSPSLSNEIVVGQDRLKSGSLKMDLLHSRSPEGPLHLGRSGKCNSASMEDHDNNDDNDNNDDSSDSHSWNIQHPK